MEKRYDVLAVGIAAVDDLLYVSSYPPLNCKVPVYRKARHGGGPACTAIATVGSLTGKAAYIARFGDNALSHFIASSLRDHGVDVSHIVPHPSGAPYHSIIVVDNSGNRNVFYDASLYQTVTADDVPDSLIQSASVVLLDHLTGPGLLGVAKKARALRVPIVGDIEGCSESAMALAALTDYLIVPLQFAVWASRTEDPAQACAFLARTNRLAMIVTNGAEGCYYSTTEEPAVQHLPAFQVSAVDTNGCGDVFHGAFAFAIARHIELRDTLVFASAAAALKAQGADGAGRGWNAIPSLPAVLSFLQTRGGEHQEARLLSRLRTLHKS